MRDIRLCEDIMSNQQLRRRAKLMLSHREKAAEKLDAALRSYEKMLNGHHPRKELKLEYESHKVNLCKNSLSLIEGQLEFLRPRQEADVIYRNRQSADFSRQIENTVPSELPLRFHGCPIYTAKNIILSGNISSSVDRLGVGTSYDGTGQISVTTKDSIGLTLDSYSNLTQDYDLPAGCVFVVTPKNLADEQLGHHLMMENVDFLKNPDRLVAVISTPENTPSIQAWLQSRGLSKDKAYDYDAFISSFERVLASLKLPYGDFIKKPSALRKMSLDERISQAGERNSSMHKPETYDLGKGPKSPKFER